MTGNYLPWLVLLGVVAASLVFKGYVKLPSLGGDKPKGFLPPQAIQATVPAGAPSLRDLDGIDSHTLGLAFAKAKRAEVEAELAHQIAHQAGETIKAAFSAPFSAPAPAGPTPPPASAPQ